MVNEFIKERIKFNKKLKNNERKKTNLIIEEIFKFIEKITKADNFDKINIEIILKDKKKITYNSGNKENE